MKKISTLFKKDPADLSRVINEVNPENTWDFDLSKALPTRKYDGSACAIIDGKLYKRHDVKKGKSVPPAAIKCQEPDTITGHWPHWVPCLDTNRSDIWHIEALKNTSELLKIRLSDGTYELLGEKIQGNPEKIEGHILIPHGKHEILGLVYPLTFEGIKSYLEKVDIEGIVFHNRQDGRMCKIRKSDFGLKR